MTMLITPPLTHLALCFAFGAPPEAPAPAPVDLSFDTSARVDAVPADAEPPPAPEGAPDGAADAPAPTDAPAAAWPAADAAAGAPASPPPPSGAEWQSSGDDYAVPYADRAPREYPTIPIRWRAELGLAAASNIGTHPSYLVMEPDRRTFVWEVSARGDARLGESRFFLGGTLGVRRVLSGWNTGLLGGEDVLNSVILEPKVGVRASVMAVEGVDVMLTLAGGPSLQRYTVEVFDGSGNTAQQRNLAPLVEPGAGVLLYLPKKWLPKRGSSRVTVGLELAASYAWRGPVRLEPELDQADDDIAADTVSFGTLRMSGVNLQAAFVLRFM
jgi:hypothetical protein